ncbi:unnamed protein product, partial [marine sediment metagenome]
MKRLLCAFLVLNMVSANGACCCGSHSNCCKPKDQNNINKEIKDEIKEAYTQVAQQGGFCSLFGGGCCGGGTDLSQYIGYSKEELEELEGANLGLGCGNPVNLGEFKE